MKLDERVNITEEQISRYFRDEVIAEAEVQYEKD